MSDLRELYQDVILDHNRRPRNSGRLNDPTEVAEGHNPLCGDVVLVTVKTDGGIVQDIACQSSGCAVSVASASLMTEAIKGKSVQEVEQIFNTFQKMVTSTQEADSGEELGDLQVLAGVRAYPVRIKCATLSWHAMQAALHGEGDSISTE